MPADIAVSHGNNLIILIVLGGLFVLAVIVMTAEAILMHRHPEFTQAYADAQRQEAELTTHADDTPQQPAATEEMPKPAKRFSFIMRLRPAKETEQKKAA